MAVTYGFYDSLNHDRLYNAQQMSAIFDGIINDGVFMSVGNQFHTVAGTGMQVIVKSGRAWFDSTWTLNDAEYPLSIDAADVLLTRIDAVVLEVNSEVATRANTIKVIKGTPASTPAKPTLINTATIHQHALAYVTVAKNITAITNSMIEIVVGKTETPYVTAILQTTDITDLFKKWENDFQVWFETVRSTLEGDVALNLQNQINSTNLRINELIKNLETVDKKTDNIGLIKYNNQLYPFIDTISINFISKTIVPSNANNISYMLNDNYSVMVYRLNSTCYIQIMSLDGTKSDTLALDNKIYSLITTDNKFIYLYENTSSNLLIYSIVNSKIIYNTSISLGNIVPYQEHRNKTLLSNNKYTYICAGYKREPNSAWQMDGSYLIKIDKASISHTVITIKAHDYQADQSFYTTGCLLDNIVYIIYSVINTNESGSYYVYKYTASNNLVSSVTSFNVSKSYICDTVYPVNDTLVILVYANSQKNGIYCHLIKNNAHTSGGMVATGSSDTYVFINENNICYFANSIVNGKSYNLYTVDDSGNISLYGRSTHAYNKISMIDAYNYGDGYVVAYKSESSTKRYFPNTYGKILCGVADNVPPVIVNKILLGGVNIV